MEGQASLNPNVCSACEAQLELSQESAGPIPLLPESEPDSIQAAQVDATEEFLSPPSPTVLECWNAAEDAKRAMAEAELPEAAPERSSAARRADP